jgi:hypothetical protein
MFITRNRARDNKHRYCGAKQSARIITVTTPAKHFMKAARNVRGATNNRILHAQSGSAWRNQRGGIRRCFVMAVGKGVGMA